MSLTFSIKRSNRVKDDECSVSAKTRQELFQAQFPTHKVTKSIEAETSRNRCQSPCQRCPNSLLVQFKMKNIYEENE